MKKLATLTTMMTLSVFAFDTYGYGNNYGYTSGSEKQSTSVSAKRVVKKVNASIGEVL